MYVSDQRQLIGDVCIFVVLAIKFYCNLYILFYLL